MCTALPHLNKVKIDLNLFFNKEIVDQNKTNLTLIIYTPFYRLKDFIDMQQADVQPKAL